MVVLPPDVSRGRSQRIDLVLGDRLAIENHRDRVTFGLDLERIPFTDRTGGKPAHRCERINRAGLVRRLVEFPSIRVEPGVVDLDLVPVIHGELPVRLWVAAVQRRETDEDAGIVVRMRRAPVDLQQEVLELLARVPEQAYAALRF